MQTIEQRYLYKPFPGSSHSWAISKIQKISKESKILDVGIGSGIMAERLKSLEITDIYGIEIDQDTINKLMPLYKDIKTDINKLPIKDFDYCLMLDVLEHLTNPFEFLETLKKYLNDNAILLISVPNIAHWSIRLSLLFGFFEYTERGLLDKTHYSFFNKKRALKMSKIPNFKLLDYKVSSSPIEYFLPEKIWKSSIYKLFADIREKFINLFPGLFGYQHLLLIKYKK